MSKLRMKRLVGKLDAANKKRAASDTPETREKMLKLSMELETVATALLRDLSNKAIQKLNQIIVEARALQTQANTLQGKNISYKVETIKATEVNFRNQLEKLKESA